MAQRSHTNRKSSKASSLWEHCREYLLWVAVSVVCFCLLWSVFTFYWKDRIDYGRLDECQLVSYTAVQYLNTEEVMKKDFRFIDEKMLTDLGVVSGWGVLYGGLDKETILQALEDAQWDIDVLAVNGPDGYKVIIGELTEEQFRERSDRMYKGSMNSGEWQPDIADGVNYSVEESDTNSCWVSCTFESTGYEMLVKVSDESFFKQIMEAVEIKIPELVEQCSYPDSGGLICVDKETGKVAAVKGSLKIKVGDRLERKPSSEGFMTIGGQRCMAAESENDDYRFIAAIPTGSSKWMRVFSAPFVAISFTLLLLLSILYAWFLRGDIMLGRTVNKLSGEKAPDQAKLYSRRVRLLFLTLSAIITAICILLISLFILDHTRMRASGLLEDSYQYFSDTAEKEMVMDEAEDEARLKIASAINLVITQAPELVNDSDFHDLGVALAGGVYALDRDGTVAAGGAAWDFQVPVYNLSELSAEDSQWAPLNEVLTGKADSQSADVIMNDEDMNACGIRRLDAPGMLVYMREKSRASVSESMYSNFPMAEGRVLFAVNLDTEKVVSCSDSQYIGINAKDFGMTKNSLKPGYVGDLNLPEGMYYIVTQEYSGILTCMGVSIRYIVSTYLFVIVLTVLTGFAVAGALLWIVLTLQKRRWPIPRSAERRSRRRKVTVTMNGNGPYEDETADNGQFYNLETGGLTEQTSADERWNNITIPFSKMFAEEKFSFVLNILAVFALILIYAHPELPASIGSHMSIEYLLSRQWEYGINVYGISYCLLVVLEFYVISALLRRFVMLVGGNFGNRGETIARLIESFINYVAIFSGIAVGLRYLGVDTTTILASVGIVGLGLSLGAKDLITDILAGIGIVFEGEFRNGDIISIDGYRGTVIDIGVRTTKVLSNSNVKIFRNSAVSGVINMTQRYSYAEVKIQVARSEPLERVEEIFKNELPLIQKKIPEMGEDIRMLGISEMTADSITLSITASCNERDREKVIRAMYREINLMMTREGLKPKG